MCSQGATNLFSLSAGGRGLPVECRWINTEALALADKARRGQFVSYQSLIKRYSSFPFKLSLYDFQVSGMLFLYYAKKCLLADATGLGKTVQVLALFSLLKQLGEGESRWVIVVPPSVVYQWEDEFRKFTDFFPVLAVGDRQTRIPFYLTSNWTFLITTYQLLWRDWELLVPLRVQNWVFDDAHFFKNHDTKTAHVVKVLTRDADRVVLTTATPVQKTPMDIHSLLESLQLNHVFGSRIGFENHYCVIRQTVGVRRDGRHFRRREFIRAKNTKELREKLRPVCLKRTFKAVGHLLPALTVQPIWLDFSLKQRQLYEQKKQSIIQAYDKGVLRGVKNSGFHSMRQICGGTYTFGLNEDVSVKLDALDFFITERLGKDEKVVIYAFYKRTVQSVVQRLLRLRYKGLYDGDWVLMTGDDKSMASRESAKKTFTNKSSCRVLIGTDAIQMGLNLQVARYLIMLDLIPNAKNIEQLIGRLRRMGGVQHVIVYPLLIRRSIEESIWRRTRFEAAMNDNIFNEQGDVFCFSDAEFIELIKEF